MNRIDQVFARLRAQGEKALITFTMAGDPDAARSLAVMEEIAAQGADIIELGMPFTDPVADGPAVQAAGLRALKSGIDLKGALKIVQQFRSKNNTTPIVLMGYLNPVLQYGEDDFVNDCNRFGVDGLILVDMPPEEALEFSQKAQQKNLALIRLITPTTDEKRLGKILPGAGGFLYYVSITGVTGTKTADSGAVQAHIGQIRQYSDLPVMVGFGIKTPADAEKFASFADGVVVGSAIVENINKYQDDSGLPSIIGAQIKALKNAV